jgi:hypothetical protein
VKDRCPDRSTRRPVRPAAAGHRSGAGCKSDMVGDRPLARLQRPGCSQAVPLAAPRRADRRGLARVATTSVRGPGSRLNRCFTSAPRFVAYWPAVGPTGAGANQSAGVSTKPRVAQMLTLGPIDRVLPHERTRAPISILPHSCREAPNQLLAQAASTLAVQGGIDGLVAHPASSRRRGTPSAVWWRSGPATSVGCPRSPGRPGSDRPAASAASGGTALASPSLASSPGSRLGHGRLRPPGRPSTPADRTGGRSQRTARPVPRQPEPDRPVLLQPQSHFRHRPTHRPIGDRPQRIDHHDRSVAMTGGPPRLVSVSDAPADPPVCRQVESL